MGDTSKNKNKTGDNVDKYIQDKKRLYLIKTLSRTKRKDYENYIINGIWHRLNNLDIQPVTQQFVQRSDGKRALIDLYFPQINYGIECDEAYHIGNMENDITRELTMEEMLNSISETEDFILRRVPVYECIEKIDKNIANIVDEIKELVSSKDIIPWDVNRDASEVALAKRKLSVYDSLRFSLIIDICKCFGKSYKGMQRCFFDIGNDYQIWCPKLAIKTKNSVKAVSNGWLNLLSDDWEYISESNDTMLTIEPTHIGRKERITFAKSKDALGRDAYRFIGVFVYSEEKSSGNENIYVRVKKEVDLTQWF